MNYRLVNQMYWFLCHKDMNNYDCNHHFWIVFYDCSLNFLWEGWGKLRCDAGEVVFFINFAICGNSSAELAPRSAE